MNIDIKNIDCYDFLKSIESNSIDFVCIDPPYTDGVKDVLSGHKIQTKIDIPLLMSEINRVLKPDSFFAFFGKMPTIVEWHLQASVFFEFNVDIVWAKRTCSSPFQRILRTSELLYIYKKGCIDYFDTLAPFEDIKIPLCELGLYDFTSIKRYFADFRKYIKTGKINIATRNNIVNDTYYPKTSTNMYRFKVIEEGANISDIWSFTPENKVNRNSNNIKHPTVKPILLLERLIKLCTCENAVVLDCFLGSGTTAIACKKNKRNFKGCELDSEYYSICIDRLNNANIKNEIDFN